MGQTPREVETTAPRPTHGRRLLIALVTLLASLGLLVVVAPSASAGYTPDGYAARMAQLINETRTAHGLRPVTVTSGTSRVALGWATQLADRQALSHNPRLAQQVEANGSPNWTVVSENVGSGYVEDPDAVFAAYLNSPGHRRNILDARMRFVGVAAVFTGNTAWDVMNFVDSYGTPAAAPAPVAAPAQPAPAKQQTARTAPVAARPVPQEVVAAPAKPAAAPQKVTPAPAKKRLAPVRSAPAVRPRVADHTAARPVAAPTALFEQPLIAFELPAPAAPAAPAGTLPLAVVLAAGLLVAASGGLTVAVARRR